MNGHLGLATLALLHALAVARPKPLPSQAECASYQGSAIGNNDPTQLFELRVCQGPTGVEATLQSSSLVSGHSSRASEGRWDASGTTLRLVETRFIESRPEPGWRFCLIDELVLSKTASGNLEGTYVSHECSDRAELVLRPLVPGEPMAEPAPVPERSPSEPPRAEPPRAEPPDDSRPEACTCASEPSSSVLSLGLLALLLVRRRGARRISLTRQRLR